MGLLRGAINAEMAKKEWSAARELGLPITLHTNGSASIQLLNDNNLLGAATALDQLANEAALVGDLPVEALAIFNSAWLYSKAGRNRAAVTRVARLKGLLRSRYMPVAIRDQLMGRLNPPSEVATY